MEFDFLEARDIVIIVIIIFIINVLKQIIKNKWFYVFLPFILSIIFFIIFLFLKVYIFSDMFFIILKWSAGSIMFYDLFFEKIRKVIENGKNKQENIKND